MGSTRKKPRKPQKPKTLDSDDSPHHNIFRSIISQIEAPQGLKLPSLKRLYNLLSYFSSFQQECGEKGADINGFVMKIGNSDIWIDYKELCKLSDILFKELFQRFEQLCTVWHDISESMALGRPGSQHTDMWVATDELNLLFRCCMIVLILPVSQENLLENGRALLLIIGKLSLIKLGGKEKNVTDFGMYSSECSESEKDRSAFSTEKNVSFSSFLHPLNPCIAFLSAILEVVMDELLLHGQLRKKLLLLDSCSHTCERLFMHLSCHCDIGIVMELISTHFLLSVSNDLETKDFLNRLAGVKGKKFKAPELSLVTARSLVLDPVMRSSPKILQAHFLSMLSDSIGISMVTENSKPDPRLIHSYLSALQSSVILYSQDMSWLRKELHTTDARKTFHLSFETYLEKSKKMELDRVISKLNDLWGPQFRSTFLRTKTDLVTFCTKHMQESGYILDMSRRDEMLFITERLLVRVADDFHSNHVPYKESTSLEDICLLASLLKLMSTSLFQALSCLTYSGDPHCLRNFKDFSFMKIISCFEEFSIHLSIQSSLSVLMETCPSKHKELRVMLQHFIGLLSLSFQTGADFLVKNCILIIMALMNLFVFEEGNLDSLRMLNDPVDSQGALMDQTSSLAAASKCQNVQNLDLSKVTAASDSTEGEGEGEGEEEEEEEDMQSENPFNTEVPENTEQVSDTEKEVCNGEIFLKSIVGNGADLDDLSDFIVCKEGKNYGRWLKDRERYRRMKFKREAKLRWKKRQKTYRSVVGQNTRTRSSARKKT